MKLSVGCHSFFMDKKKLQYLSLQLSNLEDVLHLINTLKEENQDGGYEFTTAQLHAFANLSYHRKKFNTFSIPKKRRGERIISAPATPLYCYLLRYINLILQSVYVPPRCATGFIPGKSIVSNAQFHVGKKYVYNIDLKDFFLSISRKQVWEALQKKPFNWPENVAYLIAFACSTNSIVEEIKSPERYCLPQGAPTSPILTNIVCLDLDKELTELSKRYGVTYSRYADDMSFSSDNNVFSKNGRFQKNLKKIIRSHNLRINSSKTRLQHAGQRQEVTGLMVREKVNVNRNYIRSLRNLFYIWETYGSRAAESSLSRIYCSTRPYKKNAPGLVNVVYGKLMYLKMVKGDTDPLFQKMFNRFCHLLKTRPVVAKTSYKVQNIEAPVLPKTVPENSPIINSPAQ